MKIRPRAGASAFTLIELLVVIAIIALLIAILLPALGRAREEGKKVKEESLGHQMVIGMAAYYTDSQDKIMPAGPHWAWDHAPPNEYSIFPPDPNRNGVGTGLQQGLLEGSCTKVWTLYFVGYTNWRLPQIQVDKSTQDAFNSRANAGGQTNNIFWGYGDTEVPVAYAWHPTMGMNGTYVGGAYSFGGFRGQGPPRPSPHTDTYGDPTPIGNPRSCGGQFYVRQAADPRMPSNLLFFASSRGGDVNNTTYWGYGDTIPNQTATSPIRPGYWIVTAPVNSPRHRGTSASGYQLEGAWNASNAFDKNAPAGNWGMLDMRWSKKAVTAMFDGSVKMQGLDDLRDMTKWANVATDANWTFPTNPNQIFW